MSSLKFAMVFGVALALTACGGGGGSPGKTSGDQSSGVVVVASKNPILTLALQDASGVATNSISSSGFTILKALLTDPSGNPIANQVVSVSADAGKIIFPEGETGLTNAAGIASIKLTRATLVATGAGSLTVTYAYKVGSIDKYPDGSAPLTADTVISKYIGYQLSAANITLASMDVGASTLAAYGTRQVSVQANIDGVASTGTPVQVSFSANCGQVSPATAATNGQGVALVTYTATDAAGTALSTQGCSGKKVDISATTVGANVLTKSLNISAAPATNLSFVSATPTRIFLANSGGLTQSIVAFKLINAREEPLLGQDVQLTLKTLNGGVPKASFGTVDNVNAVVLTTNSEGKVSVPVFSGTVPTSVLVNAALVSNPLVQTDSAVLSIASGRPAQARVSLAIEKLSIEGGSLDGVSTNVTLSLADRQGNPVPDGTAVNFVTEGGVMIPPVCYTGGTKDPISGVFSQAGSSQCTVSIRSQNPRPANGRVSILAYAAGEEDFVDANFNNVYDCGETFTDLGTAYRDDNESGTFDTGEFSVPRNVSASTCAAGVAPSPQIGDGVWGAADVRRQGVIVFASSTAVITAGSLVAVTPISGSSPVTNGLTSIIVTVADTNGNSMPTGSKIVFSAIDDGFSVPGYLIASCTVSSGLTYTLENTSTPSSFPVSLAFCTAGDSLNVKVTSPLGAVTERTFTVTN